MTDSTESPRRLVDVDLLAAALRQFAADRDWAQFHSPKNLVMALTGEVGELAEVFQWMTEEESKGAARHPPTAEAVRHELADVLLYLVRAADVLGVDLNLAVSEKMKLNAERGTQRQHHTGLAKNIRNSDSRREALLIIYQAEKQGFIRDVRRGDIDEVILELFKTKTGRRVGTSEQRSWEQLAATRGKRPRRRVNSRWSGCSR